MKIAPTKTVWMHVGVDETLETLTVEGERIARVQRVTYLDSVLNANEDLSKRSACKYPTSQAANHKDQTLTKQFRGSKARLGRLNRGICHFHATIWACDNSATCY